MNVKIVEHSGGTTTSAKQFVWCGSRRCEARDASSNLLNQYFAYGQTISSNNHFYTKSHLNSVCELTDNSGALKAQYNYDCCGVTGSTVNSDFLFAGYYYHLPSKLSFTLTRAYNSNLARWISRDTVGENSSVNLFSYVDNRQLNANDPSGRGLLKTCIVPGKGHDWNQNPSWGNGPLCGVPPEQQPPVIQDPRNPTPLPPLPIPGNPDPSFPDPDPNPPLHLPDGTLISPVIGEPGFWFDSSTGTTWVFNNATGEFEELPGISPGQLHQAPDVPFI